MPDRSFLPFNSEKCPPGKAGVHSRLLTAGIMLRREEEGEGWEAGGGSWSLSAGRKVSKSPRVAEKARRHALIDGPAIDWFALGGQGTKGSGVGLPIGALIGWGLLTRLPVKALVFRGKMEHPCAIILCLSFRSCPSSPSNSTPSTPHTPPHTHTRARTFPPYVNRSFLPNHPLSYFSKNKNSRAVNIVYQYIWTRVCVCKGGKGFIRGCLKSGEVKG